MIYVLLGATGTGKSAVAPILAKRLNAEIINADAFQVYKGIEIATAAPNEEELSLVPSYLYSYVEPSFPYSIHEYQKDCREKIAELASKGKNALLVGGSGLYIRSALFDYDLSLDTSSVDMSKYEGMDDEALHECLKALDPKEAEKIHPHNRIRVLRAIQICLALGSSKSSFIDKQNHEPIAPTSFFLLTKDREELYKKVDERVIRMVSEGLFEKTIPVIEKYGREAPAFKAIGVKELFLFMDGQLSKEETIALIQKDTRNYIKRQETFFAHQFKAKQISSIDEIIQ